MMLKQIIHCLHVVFKDALRNSTDSAWVPCESLFCYYQIVDNYYFQLVELRQKVSNYLFRLCIYLAI